MHPTFISNGITKNLSCFTLQESFARIVAKSFVFFLNKRSESPLSCTYGGGAESKGLVALKPTEDPNSVRGRQPPLPPWLPGDQV